MNALGSARTDQEALEAALNVHNDRLRARASTKFVHLANREDFEAGYLAGQARGASEPSTDRAIGGKVSVVVFTPRRTGVLVADVRDD